MVRLSELKKLKIGSKVWESNGIDDVVFYTKSKRNVLAKRDIIRQMIILLDEIESKNLRQFYLSEKDARAALIRKLKDRIKKEQEIIDAIQKQEINDTTGINIDRRDSLLSRQAGAPVGRGKVAGVACLRSKSWKI